MCVLGNTPTRFADFVKNENLAQYLLISSWTSQLKHLLLRARLADCLPEMLSQAGVFAGRSMNKLKKLRAMAQAALGHRGDLAPKYWIQDPGSWIQDPGTGILDQG